MGKVGINLGGWYGIYLGGKGSLFVYTRTATERILQLPVCAQLKLKAKYFVG